eukprot:IDg8441t1
MQKFRNDYAVLRSKQKLPKRWKTFSKEWRMQSTKIIH